MTSRNGSKRAARKKAIAELSERVEKLREQKDHARRGIRPAVSDAEAAGATSSSSSSERERERECDNQDDDVDAPPLCEQAVALKRARRPPALESLSWYDLEKLKWVTGGGDSDE